MGGLSSENFGKLACMEASVMKIFRRVQTPQGGGNFGNK